MKGEAIEDVSQLTLENLLMEKFRELQRAREAGDAEFFDNFSTSLEILLKASPKAYNDLMAIKEEMQQELEEEYMNIQQDASQAQDEIYRQHMLESRMQEADWLYRITYEEVLIEIMQKNRIIGTIMPKEIPEPLPEEPIQEYEPVPQQQEPKQQLQINPPVKKNKPKLMRQQ